MPSASSAGLSQAAPRSSAQASAIYEDTELVPAFSSMPRGAADGGGAYRASAAGFYEDTEFRPSTAGRPPVNLSSSALGGGVYEDTGVFPLAAPAARSGAPSFADAGPGQGMPVYEDTDFGVGRGAAEAGPRDGGCFADGRPAALSGVPYEDTDYFGGVMLGGAGAGVRAAGKCRASG